jgi:hypothetical protein
MPNVEREQRGNPESSTSFEAAMRIWAKHVLIEFATGGDQRGDNFRIIVRPEEFCELAKIMMQANPVIAIKAFGSAMQLISQDA